MMPLCKLPVVTLVVTVTHTFVKIMKYVNMTYNIRKKQICPGLWKKQSKHFVGMCIENIS